MSFYFISFKRYESRADVWKAEIIEIKVQNIFQNIKQIEKRERNENKI